MMGYWTYRLAVSLVLVHLVSGYNPVFNGQYPETCIEGDYQKATPSAQNESVPLCQEWSSRSCCWANTTKDLYDNRVTGSEKGWNRCGPVSDRCLQYLMAESCFYECEPMLKHYEIARNPGDLGDVPICGKYCDDWYEACRDDRTCARDWLEAFYDTEGRETCPNEKQPCITFGEMYKNGEDMCNSIWSIEYIYEPTNENCMVMQFSGENPNLRGAPYTAGAPGLHGALNSGLHGALSLTITTLTLAWGY